MKNNLWLKQFILRLADERAISKNKKKYRRAFTADCAENDPVFAAISYTYCFIDTDRTRSEFHPGQGGYMASK